MITLKQHKENTLKLMGETAYLGINPTALYKHIQTINKAIEQSNCNHEIVAEPFHTHNATGIVWKCEKCGKILEIETNG